jgi:hypothetical protein
MNANDPRGALRELVDLQMNKVWPENDDWIKCLEALMKDGALFSETAGNISLPMAVISRNFDVVAANGKLLEETGLTEQDIKDEKVALLDTGSAKLDDALSLVFHTKTSIVNSLVDPLYALRLPGSKVVSRVYQSAIVFPYAAGDGPVTRGIVLFLPMEL